MQFDNSNALRTFRAKGRSLFILPAIFPNFLDELISSVQKSNTNQWNVALGCLQDNISGKHAKASRVGWKVTINPKFSAVISYEICICRKSHYTSCNTKGVLSPRLAFGGDKRAQCFHVSKSLRTFSTYALEGACFICRSINNHRRPSCVI